MKKTFFFAPLFLLLVTGHGQEADALVKNAMTKSGDWNAVKTISYYTTGKNYNKWQNYNFQKPVPTKDEAFRAFDFTAPAYYTKTTSRYGGGYLFEFANVGKDTTRYVYDLLKSRNGHQLQQGGKRVFEAGLLFVNETFPFYALRTVLQSGDTLQRRNDSTVRRLLKDGSHEEMVFGEDGLLRRMLRVQKAVTTEKRFSHYKKEKGLVYPKTTALYTNGELTRIDDVEKLSVNEPFDEKLLVIPAEYKAAPPAAPLKAREVSKDVFVAENVSGGRNVMFVNLRDGVLVTEAPVSNEACKILIDLIHQTLPKKKIRYVHLSHFHNDHTSGINAFLAEGAVLIATPATLAAVKTIITGGDSLTRQYLPFTKEHVIRDGHEVRFYEMPNTHAEGMSFVYLPQEQLIYQDDLYSLPEDKTLTPAIEINRDFYRFIQERKLAVKRIVGHHGASDISFAELEKAVRMKPQK